MKSVLKYGAMVTPPLVGIWIILKFGEGLVPSLAASHGPVLPGSSPATAPLNLVMLLLQVAVILTAARAMGWLLGKLRQPQVVGEMTAGIMLGPSLLGWLAPGVSAWLFAPASMSYVNALSQVGLVVFMFVVGLELRPAALRGREHSAIMTSHVSILIPFLLGSTLALALYSRLSNPGVPFSHFALFLGVSMSITAFPVLARILTERQLLHTRAGAIAIACAAVDDVTAWCILAGVVLLVRANSAIPFPLTLGGTALYAVLMLLVARPLAARLIGRFHSGGQITANLLAFILLFALSSAVITEALGIHALFGAFLAGAVMPKDDEFVQALTDKVALLTIVLLLPLFFAYTGLRTNIGALGGDMWVELGLVLLVAIAGKFGGASISARLSGLNWREAGAVGVLMNTRGLVELVALNIGLEIGVLSPTLFSMLVVMALVTTVMTTPLLDWIYPRAARVPAVSQTAIDEMAAVIPDPPV